MSARNIVGGLAGAAVGAVKHPVSTAKGVVSAGTTAGTAVVGRVRGGAGDAKDKAAGTAKETAAKATSKAKEAVKDPAGAVKETTDKATDTAVKAAGAAVSTASKAKETAKGTAEIASATAKQAAKKQAAKAPGTKKAAAKKAPAKKAPKREPQVVLAEPAPPLEPPIDVVGEALKAEAEPAVGAGRSTEPRGASRDEEHGDAALQRAEAAEIAAEIAEASQLDLDIETPVGTTGAEVGNNPDTAEADLQQPGTEPLLDPSLVKEVKSESETLRKASEN